MKSIFNPRFSHHPEEWFFLHRIEASFAIHHLVFARFQQMPQVRRDASAGLSGWISGLLPCQKRNLVF